MSQIKAMFLHGQGLILALGNKEYKQKAQHGKKKKMLNMERRKFIRRDRKRIRLKTRRC